MNAFSYIWNISFLFREDQLRRDTGFMGTAVSSCPWNGCPTGLVPANTVDGFQGQERDVILVSLVRSNEEGQIGFLRDLRRMNVAITRARMKLIILGDVATLTKHPFYKKLWEYCENEE